MNLPLETPADREAAKEVIAMVKRIEAFKAAA
jgi:hypothetical protein